MAADLRAAEMRAADLSGELAAREDGLARWRAEAEQLRGLVAQMDRDRDGLQVGSGAPGKRPGLQGGVKAVSTNRPFAFEGGWSQLHFHRPWHSEPTQLSH